MAYEAQAFLGETQMSAEDSTLDDSKKTPKFWLHRASGNLALKRKGRTYYFGKDPALAASHYRRYQGVIESGQTVPSINEVDDSYYSIADICNLFLMAQKKRVAEKTLSNRSFVDYKKTCEMFIEHVGRERDVDTLNAQDFSSYRDMIAGRRNLIGVGNEVTRVKTIFKWAFESEYLVKPIRFGPEFKRPPNKAVRRHRREKGPQLFTAKQVNMLLDEVGLHLHAMVLLGINAGLKNADIGQFPVNIDFSSGFIDYPRPKTEVDRRFPLWPETREALERSLSRRPEPQDGFERLFFLTHEGKPWTVPDSTKFDLVSQRTTQALQRLRIHEPGMSFSWLRPTFRTRADEVKDQPAANFIMGHADNSMAAIYRQEISDERLVAVTEHVRKWLFDFQ